MRVPMFITGMTLVIHTLSLLTMMRVNLGVAATVMLGSFYMGYSVFYSKIKAATRRGPLKWIKLSVWTLHTMAVATLAMIAIVGKADTVTYKEDAVIVLGAAIRGESITRPLKYRLDKCVEYAQKNSKAVIVLSGGQGLGESIPEALAMKRYLLEKGIDEDRILMEDASTNTYENFVLSKQKLDGYFEKGYETAFITNGFHIFRAGRIARQAGLATTHLHAQIQWYIVPVMYMRELLGLIKFLIFRS